MSTAHGSDSMGAWACRPRLPGGTPVPPMPSLLNPARDLRDQRLRLVLQRGDVRSAANRELSLGREERDGRGAVVILVDNNIAGKQQPDLRLFKKGARSQMRVACAQDHIAPKIQIEFLLHCSLDVDLGENAETVLLQLLGRFDYGLVERKVRLH